MKFSTINIALLLMQVSWVIGQTNHTVYFEPSKSSISLQQLDSIKEWAANVLANPTARVQVFSYANDAVLPESNYILAGRRALLIQQCLERAGIPLESMYIERKVNRGNTENGCTTCSEMTITSNANFSYQNLYQDLVEEHLMRYSAKRMEVFELKNKTARIIQLNNGMVIHIPEGAFGTAQYPVQLEFKSLNSLKDLLLHSLATKTNSQTGLLLGQAIYLQATHNGIPIQLQPPHQITIIGSIGEDAVSPEYYHKKKAWEKGAGTWMQSKFFDKNLLDDCTDKEHQAVRLPSFDTPPSKPTYILVDTSTRYQDEQIAKIDTRLAYLETQRRDEKGKKRELSKAQKNSESQLKAKRDRFLIAKEKIRIKITNSNATLEESYYTTLALYNEKRHEQQRTYLDALATSGMEQQRAQNVCADRKIKLDELGGYYDQENFIDLLVQLQLTPKSSSDAFWLRTSEMGWLGIGSSSNTREKGIPCRVVSPISAYKVSTFLLYEDQIWKGTVIDQSDIVFWEVPEGKEAKLLAITKEGDDFLVAWQSINTSTPSTKLEFTKQSLRKIIATIK